MDRCLSYCGESKRKARSLQTHSRSGGKPVTKLEELQADYILKKAECNRLEHVFRKTKEYKEWRKSYELSMDAELDMDEEALAND